VILSKDNHVNIICQLLFSALHVAHYQKKKGQILSEDDINGIMNAYHNDNSSNSDRWMAKFLMAVKEVGLDSRETAYLTKAMAIEESINYETVASILE
jgi:thymidine phosphorylase